MIIFLICWLKFWPAFVTGNNWYNCVKNMKTIKNHHLGFLVALESNHLASIEEGTWVQVQKLDIPNDGLEVWLRDFGDVKLFRIHLKNQVRHYAIHLPDENDLTDNESKLGSFKKPAFEMLDDQHWQIEQYHHAIKQVCNIESFQFRGKVAV
jgi:hypothetical protein